MQNARKGRRGPPSVGAIVENQLLASLPPDTMARLAPHLETVSLDRKEVLFHAHEPLSVVHFPLGAVVSFIARLESGDMLEVGLVGRDGFAGTAVLPGVATMSCEGIVQVPGMFKRMSADVLRRLILEDETLHGTLGRYAQVLLARSMQMSVCNTFHSVERRCIRWLLNMHDLTDQESIPLTHELLATMLGVHRPTVTLVLGALYRNGLIGEERGLVIVRNRRGLEEACCECYGVMRTEQRRLMGY